MIGLLAAASVWERNFLENGVPGIYWLFVAYGKIAGWFTYLFYLTGFFFCLFLVAPPHLVGIFGFFKGEPLWARYRPSNSKLLVFGRLMLAIFVCIGSTWLGVSPFGHINRHVDTVHGHGSVYHLAYAMSGNISEWEAGRSFHYVLTNCDLGNIVCSQIDDIPADYWPFVEDEAKATSLNYDAAADEIQVIERGTTIYTYQP
ncbi:MAG: hypothetical protein JXB30_12140 [Anaerolineae bacterium]|nr:hypothetical protein [Anaerolineae bacterium]